MARQSFDCSTEPSKLANIVVDDSINNGWLNPLSVSGLSLKLVKSIFEKPEEQNVLILGAGSLAQAVIENLNKKGINKIKPAQYF